MNQHKLIIAIIAAIVVPLLCWMITPIVAPAVVAAIAFLGTGLLALLIVAMGGAARATSPGGGKFEATSTPSLLPQDNDGTNRKPTSKKVKGRKGSEVV